MTHAEKWAEALGEWALPDWVLSCAPEAPWGFSVSTFVDAARVALTGPPTPTHRRVSEALADGGTLIDVGCGGGAASLPVAPPAGRVVAVDEDPRMLEAMEQLAAGRPHFELELVQGRWPDVAGAAGSADVVVCANVAYNVADLGPFLQALTGCAKRRVVLELTAVHPQTALAPLWRHFWDLPRPAGPTAEDAIAVVRESLGLVPKAEQWERPLAFMLDKTAEQVANTRRRLCLTPDRDEEIEEQLQLLPTAPSRVWALWWPGRAGTGSR
ncbi:MAG TPA: class I SAM-dependent methyltransferase [Acidimicrobiales bacterium]|nr:class I SAM-dependent methyltransferase [Acidimicrobiales bacterium]